MLKMEIVRIYRRPVFWILIIAGFFLAIIPVIEMWPKGITDEDYIFYPRSAYVSWMYFGSDIYYVYGLIFPLLASLSYADSYAEDYNTGFIKGILTKVEKKNYLIIRYFVNFCVGGLVAVFPLIINFLGLMTAFPLIDNNYYFGMALVKEKYFLSHLFYHHPFIYIMVRILLLFFLGAVLASFGLALSTVVKNRYIVLVFPFLLFMGTDVITATFNPNYSVYSLFLGNIEASWQPFVYLIIGILGSYSWYYITGERNETI